MVRRSVNALPLAIALLSGCVSRDEDEARRVLGAIEALRDADGPVREEKLATLERLSPKVAEAEAARSACATAYRALVDTQRLVAEAKGPPIDAAKLARAQESLGRAREGIGTCSVATTALRRWLEKN